MCIIVFSGFGKPCSYSLYRIFIVFCWFSSRDKTLPDTFKCSTIKWNCRHHYHNHHIPPLSHHNYHYHPPLSPRCENKHSSVVVVVMVVVVMLVVVIEVHFRFLKEVSQESFVFTSSTFTHFGGSLALHLQLSVFEGSLARKLLFHILHFQFQQLIREKSEPCHVLRLLTTHLRSATCGKKNSFSASNGPASGR